MQIQVIVQQSSISLKSKNDSDVLLEELGPAFLSAKPLSEFRGRRVAEFILKRLNTWQKEHVRCARSARPLLPSRVIDVGDSGHEPRLCTSNAGDRVDYVTLSYCWGGVQELTTTTNTLLSRQESMPLSTLPCMILDAIEVTRSLGIQ